MKAKLLTASGYQGDALNLPVADAEVSADFYVRMMGFTVVDDPDTEAEVSQAGVKRIVIERDGMRMGLAENGGDPEQDGCAFRTDDVVALRDEFIANGLEKIGEIDDGTHGFERFRIFFVVAPDGLCFWFGQKV